MGNQLQIWNDAHGYKGTSRKWAYRRSKRAMKKILAAGHRAVFFIPIVKQAYKD